MLIWNPLSTLNERCQGVLSDAKVSQIYLTQEIQSEIWRTSDIRQNCQDLIFYSELMLKKYPGNISVIIFENFWEFDYAYIIIRRNFFQVNSNQTFLFWRCSIWTCDDFLWKKVGTWWNFNQTLHLIDKKKFQMIPQSQFVVNFFTESQVENMRFKIKIAFRCLFVAKFIK